MAACRALSERERERERENLRPPPPPPLFPTSPPFITFFLPRLLHLLLLLLLLLLVYSPSGHGGGGGVGLRRTWRVRVEGLRGSVLQSCSRASKKFSLAGFYSPCSRRFEIALQDPNSCSSSASGVGDVALSVASEATVETKASSTRLNFSSPASSPRRPQRNRAHHALARRDPRQITRRRDEPRAEITRRRKTQRFPSRAV